MLRLYFDEDVVRGALVRALRRAQIDVITVAEASMRGATDEAQLAFASEHGLTLFSFNVGDYMRLHGNWLRSERTHTGIILTSQESFGIGELQRRLARIATTLEPGDMVDRVEFLNAWGWLLLVPFGNHVQKGGNVATTAPVDISQFIYARPDFHDGRPCIAGTGKSRRRCGRAPPLLD